MEDKILEFEKNILRFMQKFNIYNIPLSVPKLDRENFIELIAGNDEVLLMNHVGLYSFRDIKNLSLQEKEGIYKYVIWYCNNMIER
jgi:hypothetical protein